MRVVVMCCLCLRVCLVDHACCLSCLLLPVFVCVFCVCVVCWCVGRACVLKCVVYYEFVCVSVCF